MRLVLAALSFAGIVLSQQPDYLPLNPGNQWVYQPAGRGQPIVMEVLRSAVFDDNTYYRTRNFLNADTWLRMREDATLVAYNPDTKQESVLVAFGAAEGSTYRTSIDPCNSGAKVVSRRTKMQLPIGQFDNVLAIDYAPFVCADAGIATERYLPYVGLVQRSRETIAGLLISNLVYARIADVTVISSPEVSFNLSLDSAVYETGPVTARFTIRATQARPLTLRFRTSQEYDLVVKNEAGDVVYRWSDGRGFLQALHSLDVGPGGEELRRRHPAHRFAGK